MAHHSYYRPSSRAAFPPYKDVTMLKSMILGTTLVTSFSLAPPAAAQPAAEPSAIDVEAIRQMLIYGFEQSKQMDLDFSRAVPDSALRWAPTAGVRDFAQQIEHISIANTTAVAQSVVASDALSLGDTAVYLNDARVLEEVVAKAYEWVIEGLRDLPASELDEETELFGLKLPKWRVYLFLLTHAYWTRGQLVPYLRMNGVQPPRYQPF
jgi:uncharacterized damage-inducible protein DinB